MALNYSVALRPNPLKKDEPAKAYATAQVNGEPVSYTHLTLPTIRLV